MTAKEYLKQAYLLDKQIQVEVKELEQLREMRGTIQGCSYGEKIGTNPNRNLEAPFLKTIEKIFLSRGCICQEDRIYRASIRAVQN